MKGKSLVDLYNEQKKAAAKPKTAADLFELLAGMGGGKGESAVQALNRSLKTQKDTATSKEEQALKALMGYAGEDTKYGIEQQKADADMMKARADMAVAGRPGEDKRPEVIRGAEYLVNSGLAKSMPEALAMYQKFSYAPQDPHAPLFKAATDAYATASGGVRPSSPEDVLAGVKNIYSGIYGGGTQPSAQVDPVTGAPVIARPKLNIGTYTRD